MIITDGVHLTSTDSEQELFEFAQRLGLKADWYQPDPKHPHFDLTTPSAKLRAIDAGATLVSRRELVKTAWWAAAVG